MNIYTFCYFYVHRLSFVEMFEMWERNWFFEKQQINDFFLTRRDLNMNNATLLKNKFVIAYKIQFV